MKEGLQISVIVADAQPVFRLGMKSLLSTLGQVEIAGEASNTSELHQLSFLCQPDILILGFHPEFFNPVHLQPILLRWPACNTILLTGTDGSIQQSAIKGLPCHCMLPRECDGSQICQAVLSALRQHTPPPALSRDTLPPPEPEYPIITPPLSEREVEIIRLVASGKTNKEIAYQLSLSHHTIHSHRKNILKKLGVRSALELTTYALKAGLLTIDKG